MLTYDLDTLALRTQQLLASHVPLTLLLDLFDPIGPQSHELFLAEPAAADWLLPTPRPAT